MALGEALLPFVRGTLVMGCAVVGLFFGHYFRKTRDRLFLFFALAFGLLTLNWTTLALYRMTNETSHYVFGVRLVAFGVIFGAVVDKNRDRPAGGR